MTIFSTSTSAFFERSRSSMTSLRMKAEGYQRQLSSGEKLSSSHDSPVAASRLRMLERADRLSEISQANTDRLEADLQSADTTLASIADVLTRAQELAVQAGSDTMSAEQRAAIGQEMAQLHEQLVSLANARNLSGEALFGGETTGDAYTLDAGGNAVYIGTASAGMTDVAEGHSVPRSLTGPEVFEFEYAGTPTDAFAVIAGLADALAGGVADPALAARDASGAISAAIEGVTTNQTVLGARLTWIEFVNVRREEQTELRASEENDLGGVDIANTVINLQEALIVLEASQASFTKLSGLSLFNDIR